jgi:hypothetical protein
MSYVAITVPSCKQHHYSAVTAPKHHRKGTDSTLPTGIRTMELETGSTIGSWTLLKPDTTRAYYWQCRCTCGTIKTVRDSSLKNGKSSSCGCVRTQALSNRKTHGMTDTIEYRTWQGMKQRVRRDPNYTDVSVCLRWQEFENFYADMGRRPEGENISLGRIDNDGDYTPSNCRWETPTMQNRNKGDTVLIESQFGTRTLMEWTNILIEHTGNTTWTARKLKSFLDVWSIDRILQTEGITDLYADCADDMYQPYELIAA